MNISGDFMLFLKKRSIVSFFFLVFCGGLVASDAGVPAAGAGSGASALGRYVEVVDEEGLSKLNQDLLCSLVRTYRLPNGSSLLHYAATYGDDERALNMVRCVLYWGADINAQNNANQTALHMAAMCGNRKTMAFLLACGANSEMRDRSGQTAFETFTWCHRMLYVAEDFSREPLFSEVMINDLADFIFDEPFSSSVLRLSEDTVLLAAMCGVDFASRRYNGELILHYELGRQLVGSMGVSDSPYPSAPLEMVTKKILPKLEAVRRLRDLGAPLFDPLNDNKSASVIAMTNGFIHAAGLLITVQSLSEEAMRALLDHIEGQKQVSITGDV
jgi:hypothetical protein